MNDSYSPIFAVKQSHELLHLDSHLQKVSNTFNITYDSQWNDYSKSLLPVPIICMTLGIIGIFILQFSLCLRVCFTSCKCLPQVEGSSRLNSVSIRSTLTGPRFKILIWTFLLFAAFLVIADQALVFGSAFITTGVHDSKDSINFISSTFSSLDSYGHILLNDGYALEDDFTQAINSGCTQAQEALNEVPTYIDYVNEYLSYVSPVSSKCTDINDNLDLYGIHYKNATVWVFYIMLMVGVFLYGIGILVKSKLTLQLSIGISEILMIVLFLLIGVEMCILMGLADFCMSPVDFVPQVVPRNIYNVTSYYTTCEGVNPLSSTINEAYSLVDDLNSYLTALSVSCPGNPYIADSQEVVNNITAIISNINIEIECPPIESQITNVLNNGVCDHTFSGIYSIWLGQYISTSCLFMCTIIVTFLYQYYGQFWNDLHTPQTNVQDQILFIDNDSNIQATPNEFYYSTSVIHAEPTNSNMVVEDAFITK